MKERFLEIWYKHISREGSDALLSWMCRTDFFEAPASSRFHNSYDGGLCDHSVNVFERAKQLSDTLLQPEKRPPDESIAVASLCHDLCKINMYVPDVRQQRVGRSGITEYQRFYTIRDSFPYGHGEKSVYLASKYMKLTTDEALAIRWHMGFGDADFVAGNKTVSAAFERCPLAVILHLADTAASYLDETRGVTQ